MIMRRTGRIARLSRMRATAMTAPTTNHFGFGSEKLPNASRPAHTMKTPIRVTWPANQAMVLSPTPDTATE